MTEAIIHVGVHKTGTTSIQRAMAHNRDYLAERGFQYPRFAVNHYDLYTCFAERPLDYRMIRGRGIKTMEGVEEVRSKIFASLAKELRKQTLPRLILCSEALSRMKRDEFARLKDYVDGLGVTRTTVFIYLRDHLSYWESQVQQTIKGGDILDLARESKRLGRLRYYRETLEALQSVWGRENVKVRLFLRDRLKNGDVVVDFADEIGLDVSGIQLHRTNESISQDVMLFLNEMNRRVAAYGEHGKSVLRKGLVDGLRNFPGDKYRADRETAAAVLDKTADDRAYIAETWFGGEDALGEPIRQAMVDPARSPTVMELQLPAALDMFAHVYRGLMEQVIDKERTDVRRKLKRLNGAGPTSRLKRRLSQLEREQEWLEGGAAPTPELDRTRSARRAAAQAEADAEAD